MNFQKQILPYLTPALLSMLIFASNFLNTNLFDFGENNFAVWFVISVFCFACGWFINKTLGWNFGGKIAFAVTVATTIFSVILVSFFRDYFGSSELLTENLILFSLRNITLGAIAFFGMTVVETFRLQRELLLREETIANYDKLSVNLKKEAELELKEAKVKAEKMIQDAEHLSKNLILKKDRIEKELKEFIQIERELLKKYEQQE